MARKKKNEGNGGGGSPAWMSTFSDLMNLLLCFFVLLFSMSTIDAEKFEEIAASLKASFSIFDGGAASLTEGNLISSGISQLNDLNDYHELSGLMEKVHDLSNFDREQRIESGYNHASRFSREVCAKQILNIMGVKNESDDCKTNSKCCE